MTTTYIIVYEHTGMQYGGSEEGGWYYDTYKRVDRARIRTAPDREAAYAVAMRMNGLLDRLQKHHRATSSVLYHGGRLVARVMDTVGPDYLPTTRPYYS